jgi:hypothetical protein
MRTLLPVLAASVVLAGCSQAPQQIKSSPPTVTYQVTGNDVSEANAKAQNFCARYNTHALFEGVQATSWGKVAVYRCHTAAGVGAPPPPPSGSTVVEPPPPLESTVEEPLTPLESNEEPPPPLGSTAEEPLPPLGSPAEELPPPSESTAVEPPPPSGNTAIGPPRRLTPPAQ